ncbi:MAG: helix-turn-helix transcriptional regulator [Bacteroidetes bacterium]|nr:helix-turn-helix transcriptional regulator [Bacteroidota bacterium]
MTRLGNPIQITTTDYPFTTAFSFSDEHLLLRPFYFLTLMTLQIAAMEFNQAFCKAFKQIKSEKGVSNASVITKSNLSEHLINEVENETADPPLTTIKELAQGLDISAYELMSLAEKIFMENGGSLR